jgi:hypothetical protein
VAVLMQASSKDSNGAKSADLTNRVTVRHSERAVPCRFDNLF